MATVLDAIIVPALKEIGVLAAGQTPTAEDATDALAAANRLLDQWTAEKLQIFTTTRTPWTIVGSPATISYSVGNGGDVDPEEQRGGFAILTRPTFIDHVGVLEASTDPDTEYPLVQLTEDEYAAVQQKSGTQAALPTHWYYNPTFPLGDLRLIPIPSSTTLQGAIYFREAIAQFPAITTAVSLPPGYLELLMTNLAINLATPYGKQVDPSLRDRAEKARNIVRRASFRSAGTELSFDPGALIGRGGSWNIRTGP